VDGSDIRHRPIGSHDETTTHAWLPAGEVRIGITAGASTPDSVVGETIERILALRGRTATELTTAADIKQSIA
jgi:4-hydroxy-3-methylbut-2-enyl diphosphate reductase